MFRPSKISNLYLSLVLLIVLSGCSATKYLNEGESFYDGAEIKFDPQGKVGGKKRIEQDLQALISPKPNTKIFGMRPGVWLYYRQRDDQKNKGLKAFIRRKFGQTPILMRDVKPDNTAKLLTGQLQNDGYFGSEVEFSVKEKNKESKVIYNVLLHPPYRLREIRFPQPKDSLYAPIIRSIKKNTLLQVGQRYDLARLQAEQQRIETEVENFGLFFFDDRYLIFEADSTVGAKQIDIALKLEKGIPPRGRRIYRVGEINVFPDYTLNSDTLLMKREAIVVDSMNYYDINKKFRPHIITDVINLRKNNVYTSDDHSLTLSHLMDLGVFKFVNIQYNEVHPDSNILVSNVYVTPLKRNSLRAEFQLVSKSNSFAGPGLQLTFTNRNLFKGAELFQVRLNSSYEVQFGKRITGGALNSFELGMETSLTVPRFISPIRIDYSSNKFLPKTDFRLGFNIQNRVGYFRLNSFNVAAGYMWRESEAKSHEFYPVDVSFVQTRNRSEEFESIVTKNRFLQSSFDDQFILGSRYSYTYNNQLRQSLINQFEERKLQTHSIFFNGNLQVAGNLMNAIQNQAHRNEEGPFELFNSAYSQFVRGDIDLRYYWQIDEHNKLATRLVAGAGYAYGNSRVIPYIRQFSIGGSNSVRAFPARSLGPGSYYVLEDSLAQASAKEDGVTLFIDQRADIKLESSVELRFDIIKAFKGALFVDAGNIWLWREEAEEDGEVVENGEQNYRTGGVFGKDFYDEIAVGTGVGFRFDLNFFVLRLDIAFPLRKPWLPKGDRWVFDEIDIGSSGWRSENLIYNIAIGYPF
jgi:outer membrane protein insertion porin family